MSFQSKLGVVILYLPSTCLPAAAAAAVLKATLVKGVVDKAAEPNCGNPAVFMYAEAKGFASGPVKIKVK